MFSIRFSSFSSSSSLRVLAKQNNVESASCLLGFRGQEMRWEGMR
jgi:hypothetical protein